MDRDQTPVALAERVATVARSLRIETTLIGAYAMAIHNYVRATLDIDLASAVELPKLQLLKDTVIGDGLQAHLFLPDGDDSLGGKLVVWNQVDEEGEPLEPVEVVNFLNPFRPRRTPAPAAIRSSIPLEGMPALRYPSLAHLIALKMDAGAPRDHADVIDLLRENPDADVEKIRATCRDYGFDAIDALIANARTS
jgi:hypothetical protein